MTRFAKSRVSGSLWSKGLPGLIIGIVLIAVILMTKPQVIWFVAVAVVIGLILFPAIRWYHEKFPVKDPDADQIKLHLND